MYAHTKVCTGSQAIYAHKCAGIVSESCRLFAQITTEKSATIREDLGGTGTNLIVSFNVMEMEMETEMKMETETEMGMETEMTEMEMEMGNVHILMMMLM